MFLCNLTSRTLLSAVSDHEMISPSELAILDALMAGGKALSLKVCQLNGTNLVICSMQSVPHSTFVAKKNAI